jgi:hypothetical protein
MAVSFYIAADADRATRTPSVGTFDEVIQRQIFLRNELDGTDFPLVQRLRDRYEDAQYLTGELPGQIAELRPLAEDSNPTISRHLRVIALIAERTRETEQALFCFAD